MFRKHSLVFWLPLKGFGAKFWCKMSNLEGDTSAPQVNIEDFLRKNKLYRPEIVEKFKNFDVDLQEFPNCIIIWFSLFEENGKEYNDSCAEGTLSFVPQPTMGHSYELSFIVSQQHE